MSLDISLFVDGEEVYWFNITSNLIDMAKESDLYECIWHPEVLGPVAGHIIQAVELGLKKLKSDPDKYKKFNSKNNWGTYKDFVPFVEGYLESLKEYPNAIIETY